MNEREQLKDAIAALDAQRSVVGATIMIGEKASDLIRNGQPPPRKPCAARTLNLSVTITGDVTGPLCVRLWSSTRSAVEPVL